MLLKYYFAYLVVHTYYDTQVTHQRKVLERGTTQNVRVSWTTIHSFFPFQIYVLFREWSMVVPTKYLLLLLLLLLFPLKPWLPSRFNFLSRYVQKRDGKLTVVVWIFPDILRWYWTFNVTGPLERKHFCIKLKPIRKSQPTLFTYPYPDLQVLHN